MDTNKKNITILVPAYKEENTLQALKQELDKVWNASPKYDWELLIINDGSPDNTLDVIKKLRLEDGRVNYVDLSRNFGKENAMLAGFDYAKGDAVIIMDADLQHPPTLIPELLRYWEDGFDDVYAKRRSRGKESWIRNRLSLTFYKFLQHSSRFDILENVGDFRLLDRSCINVLKRMRETERYTKGMFAWIGYRKKEVVFDQGDRIAGESSWNFSSLANLAIEGVLSFTTIPLRLASVLGIVVSLISLSYMIWILVKTIFWGEPVAGYPTMMTVILFLGGVQLLALGIIGEYLGRVFNETKGRPVYIAREYNGEKI